MDAGDSNESSSPRTPWGTVIAVALIASLIGGAAGAIALPQIAPGFYSSLLPGQPAPQPPVPPGDSARGPGSGDQPPEVQGGVIQVADDTRSSVVGVINRALVQDIFGQTFEQQQGYGSGVVIDASGYIVTNYHVIQNASDVVVSLPDEERLEAELVGADQASDLAVLKIDPPEPLDPVEFGDSGRLQVGENVVAIGNPVGLDRTVTSGVLSGVRSLAEPYGAYENNEGQNRVFRVLQTDAAINPGNSGGALLNLDGQLVGINSFKQRLTAGVENLGFAIPSNHVRRVVNDLIEYGEVRRGYLGISIVALNYAKEEIDPEIEAEAGVYVVEVRPGSAAARAGIRPGDIVTAFDAVRLEGMGLPAVNQLLQLIEFHRPGDQVDLAYLRDGESRSTQVELGGQPE